MVNRKDGGPVSTPDSEQSENSTVESGSTDAEPPYDNMGVDSATGSGDKNRLKVLRGGDPSEYYYRLALDTLQVSIKGNWTSRRGAVQLLEFKQEAELNKQIGPGIRPIKAHDGQTLHVYPNGARPSYQVLIRGPDGLEIRALPKADMPSFMLRFGARWCMTRSVEELSEWTRTFIESRGFEIDDICTSEVHVRCDIPLSLAGIENWQLRGTSTRGSTLTVRFNSDGYETIDNQGGKKPFKFVIYDKRREQEKTHGVFWPAVWSFYSIPENVPVWRIEGKWKREALLKQRLHTVDQLTEENIAGLWHQFTTKSLVLVAEDGKRTSRSKILPVWEKIQSCGQLVEPRPVVSDEDVTSMQMFKQAAGCISKGLAITGLGNFPSQIETFVEKVLAAGRKRLSEGDKSALREIVDDVVERVTRDDSRGQEICTMVRDFVRKSLKKRLIGRPLFPSITNDEVSDETES